MRGGTRVNERSDSRDSTPVGDGPRGATADSALDGSAQPNTTTVDHPSAGPTVDPVSTEPTGSTASDGPAPRWYQRPLPFFATVLGVYFAARLFSGIVLYLVGLHQVDVVWFENEHGYLRMTVLWDAFWYRQIVEDGYPAILPRDPDSGKLWQNPWAFYPMFPMMTRSVMAITGGGFALVGSTISLLFGALAAVLISILLRDKVGPRVALAGVAVWASMITSSMLQVAYTESIAMVLLCGVLLALTKRRWWIAAGIAVLTGLSRPIAMPLGIVALVSVFLRWRKRHEEPVPTREYVAMGAALFACGLSAGIWPLIVWIGTGNPQGYTESMTAWRAYDEIQPFLPWWYSARSLVGSAAGAAVALLVLALVAFSVTAGPWARALGAQMRAWCLAYPAYLFAVMDPTSSIYRYLIPLFPWALVLIGAGWGRPGQDPLAGPEGRDADGAEPAGRHTTLRRVRRLTTSKLVRWTIIWVVIGMLAQVWWIWEIWQFTPPADDPP